MGRWHAKWAELRNSNTGITASTFRIPLAKRYCSNTTYSSGHASRSCLKRRLLADVTRPRKKWRPWQSFKKITPCGAPASDQSKPKFFLKWWVFKNVTRPRQVWRVVHLFKSVTRHMAWRVGRISTVVLCEIGHWNSQLQIRPAN